jgi:hypothetical protein
MAAITEYVSAHWFRGKQNINAFEFPNPRLKYSKLKTRDDDSNCYIQRDFALHYMRC